MAVLTAEARKKLPDSAFALPGRRFPIHNADHARAALSMLHTATPSERVTIKAKIAKKYPSIQQATNPYKKGTLNHLMHSASDSDGDGY